MDQEVHIENIGAQVVTKTIVGQTVVHCIYTGNSKKRSCKYRNTSCYGIIKSCLLKDLHVCVGRNVLNVKTN